MSFFRGLFWMLFSLVLLGALLALLFHLGYGDFLLEPVEINPYEEIPGFRLPQVDDQSRNREIARESSRSHDYGSVISRL